jgi:hypothetical protein
MATRGVAYVEVVGDDGDERAHAFVADGVGDVLAVEEDAAIGGEVRPAWCVRRRR